MSRDPRTPWAWFMSATWAWLLPVALLLLPNGMDLMQLLARPWLRHEQHEQGFGASAGHVWGLDEAIPCSVPRRHVSQLDMPLRSMDTPIIIVMSEPGNRSSSQFYHNAKFASLVDKDSLLTNYAYLPVKLTSSNSYSQGVVHTNMGRYLTHVLKDQDGHTAANESWYLFGSHEGPDWEALLREYQLPPCLTCNHQDAALSFGVGGVGSGVSWHVHGPGYSEVLHGVKRWLLYPPGPAPVGFHPNMTTLAWTQQVLPGLSSSSSSVPLMCDIGPGEALYFPHMWHHATLNLSPYTAFVSTFTTE